MTARSTKRYRIGVDATTWWNDRGFGRFARCLLQALAARESPFSYTLVVDRVPDVAFPPGMDVLARESRVAVTRAAVGAGARSLADMVGLGGFVASQRFDAFFFPSVYSYFPIPSRVPVVVGFHDTIAEEFPRLTFPTRKNELLWRAKSLLAKAQATRVLTVSNASARSLERVLGIPPSRIDVVTEAADSMFRVLSDPVPALAARADYGVPADVHVLLYAGGLNPHKNLLRLLQAMREVLSARTDTHLVIVGDTSGKGFFDNALELKQFVAETPRLASYVHFTGYVTDARLVELMNTATALVFPSLAEGFGLPALEAMACGLPVLASDRTSLPEVVGDAGMLFDPENPSSIAACIVEALGDSKRLDAMRRAGLARAATFTWDRGAELAEASFRRALSIA